MKQQSRMEKYSAEIASANSAAQHHSAQRLLPNAVLQQPR
jgi:hypothetical protein